jgi:transcription-repair coupling factor (superfamily II helicase)
MTKVITSAADILNLGLNSSKKNLVIAKDSQSAIQITENLKDLPNIAYLENSELLPYDFFSMAPITRAKRISVLSSFLRSDDLTLVTSISTLLSPCPDPNHVTPLNNLRVGDGFIIDKVIENIISYGYTREDFVSFPGQYSLRGSVLDIYLTSGNDPVRIEFFDNKIETLRTFNPESQIANLKISNLNFLPSHEYPVSKDSKDLFKLGWRENFDVFEEDSEIFSKVMNSKHPEGVEIYLPLFYGKKTTFLSFLNNIDKTFIQNGTSAKAKDFENLISTRYEEYRYDQKRPLLQPKDLFLKYDEVTTKLSKTISFDIETKALNESEKILPELERNEKADLSTSQMPSEGDLVVHLTHGIGKFVGLKQLKTFVGVSDCLEIEYKDNSKVFVPIENMNLVSRYFGPHDKDIDSLNSKKWKKRKDKALKQTFDTAAELLEVQAKRFQAKGYSFELHGDELETLQKDFLTRKPTIKRELLMKCYVI